MSQVVTSSEPNISLDCCEKLRQWGLAWTSDLLTMVLLTWGVPTSGSMKYLWVAQGKSNMSLIDLLKVASSLCQISKVGIQCSGCCRCYLVLSWSEGGQNEIPGEWSCSCHLIIFCHYSHRCGLQHYRNLPVITYSWGHWQWTARSRSSSPQPPSSFDTNIKLIAIQNFWDIMRCLISLTHGNGI
jgi:hypothetical protein